jgi:cobalt/nickel transport system permease protein
MHIPDGYMSPATGGLFYLIMAPLWFTASRAAKKTLKARQVPYLAFSASFVFVLMMFNIPAPGGSTGHAVGGTLVAVLLGPWAAMIAVTIALVIQALLFGDGGVTAIGANCFNMAFLLPFCGFYIYKLISLKSPKDSRRRPIAASLGAYFALALSSLSCAVMLGVQKALYCPYGLNITVPVMLGEHLLIFGWVEAAITFLVIKYLQKEDPSLLQL